MEVNIFRATLGLDTAMRTHVALLLYLKSKKFERRFHFPNKIGKNDLQTKFGQFMMKNVCSYIIFKTSKISLLCMAAWKGRVKKKLFRRISYSSDELEFVRTNKLFV